MMILEKKTIGEILLDTLIETNGVPCPLWGVCGAAWYPFNNEIQDYQNRGLVKYYGPSSEPSGGFMATYYGERPKQHIQHPRIGTLITTAGPGTTEAITAVANAFHEEMPLLTICSVPSDTNFQYVDVKIMTTVVKSEFIIDASVSNVLQIFKEAIRICHFGTPQNPGPGSVVIFIFKNMFDTVVPTLNQIYIPASLPSYDYQNVFDSLRQYVDPSMRIVLRIGSRVNLTMAYQLAEFSNQQDNIIVSFVYSMSSCINNLWKSEQYPRVVVEGPLSTLTYDNIYSKADRVFQLGIGVVYTLIEFLDVTKIPGIPWSEESLLFNFYDEIEPYSEAPSAFLSMNVKDINQFIMVLIPFLQEIGSSTQWIINHTQGNIEFGEFLFSYYDQRTQSTLTPGLSVFTSATLVASTMLSLYFLQHPCSVPFTLTDNHMYVVDIGAASFIGGQLIRHEKEEHLLTFSQFSPIGCSPSALAGRMLRQDYDDCVLILGDGGFLNVANNVIDLNNMMHSLKKRCLLIFADDVRYSNVAIAEENLFGNYTQLTSTLPIQQQVSATSIIQVMTSPVQSIHITEETQELIWNGALSQFIENWFSQHPGYTDTGIYLISGRTSSIPVFLEYNSFQDTMS
jgi:hypothetical protein